VLEAASVDTLDRIEGRVVADVALEEEIAAWASRNGITLLLTHHPEDAHRDYREVSRAVLNTQAAFQPGSSQGSEAVLNTQVAVKRGPLLAYVDTLTGIGPRPDVALDTTSWWITKMDALLRQASQGGKLAHRVRVVSEARGLDPGVVHAEGFTAAGLNRDRALKLLVLLEFAGTSLS
jgi:LmbE family N-acetylglucosaminyl deacetylase